MDYRQLVDTHRDELVALRRDFHKHPELSFEEVRTSKIVADYLSGLGLKVTTGVGKTGVIGLLEGASDGPTILYRADMDALPIQELNENDYASDIPGIMHACGHDSHTATAMVIAKIMSEKREQIKGRIKFVFQPAEEVGNGALAMVAEGVLENPRPDLTLGLHVWGDMQTGKVSITPGPMMSAADEFSIVVKGYGGHGSAPHQTKDPVTAAAYLVTTIQTVVSRSVDPQEMAVVTIGTINGGDAFNIIPGEITMTGTIRTYNPMIKARVHERLFAICENVGAAFECEINLDIDSATKAVINDSGVTEKVQLAAARIVDEANILTNHRTMGSEDVSEFMDNIPGCYIFVGAATEDPYPHHHARFDIDEESMFLGAAIMCEVLDDYLIK